MKRLYNKIDSKELKEKMLKSPEKRFTISFYKYQQLPNPSFFRDYLFIHWSEFNVFGRTYVSGEGINAQISVPMNRFEEFKEDLYSIRFLDGIRLNLAIEDDGKSFYKLKIKLREKIVADGLNDESFDVTNTGKHLTAKEFNSLTDDEKTILIDMRNHYEHEVGHFEGAILPDVDTFREELQEVRKMLDGKEDTNIVMYCTGGIRCEKASAWLKHEGFPKVHQLEGGIIEYARQAEKQGLDNKFIGKNFVFDERLGERISDEVIANCHQCGEPCDDHTNCVNEGCHLLFIQCESCKEKFENTCSEDCKSIIQLTEEQQRELRSGHPTPRNIFKKGRSHKLPYMNK
ncbi:MAG: rhodanese-related sulfurtransferase [Flavobacteriales bacterium]